MSTQELENESQQNKKRKLQRNYNQITYCVASSLFCELYRTQSDASISEDDSWKKTMHKNGRRTTKMNRETCLGQLIRKQKK